MDNKIWRICNDQFCIRVQTEKKYINGEPPIDDIIIDAAPIVKKFIGQPLSNLLGWCKKRIGPTECQKIN